MGAAACYRNGSHMRVTVLCDRLPAPARLAARLLSEGLMATISAFMVFWGLGLVETTWHQVIDEFPFLRVGITYLPIPLGGAVTFLFVLERLLLGAPPELDPAILRREPE